MHSPPRVLVVDDEEIILEVASKLLTRKGYEVTTATGASQALALFAPGRFEVVLSDQLMPAMKGTELLLRVKELDPGCVRVIMTGFVERESFREAINECDVFKFLAKPLDRDELLLAVQRAVERVALEEENRRLQSELARQNEHLLALNLELDQRVVERTDRLTRAETRLRALLEASPASVLTVDERGLISSMTEAAARLVGCGSGAAVGRRFDSLVPSPREASVTGAFVGPRGDDASGPQRRSVETSLRRGDGSTFNAELTSMRIENEGRTEYGVFLRDLTERDQLEAEQRHAQKLEAVGRLAAGIAHEINTPIQFVGDNLHFLRDALRDLQAFNGTFRELLESCREDIPPQVFQGLVAAEESADLDYLLEEIPKALDQSLDGVERITAIVRAMKEFAHPDEVEKTMVDLNHALSSTLTVARNELKYVAEVETAFDETLPPLLCHAGDLNQVFLNLLVNAAHAIEDVVGASGARGTIRVGTSHDEEALTVTIADTGAGIPEAIRGSVFDPFFTTKGVGRGTGQGLAIARSIVVDKHGGTIRFETAPGFGTTFSIRLPLEAGQDRRPTPEGL